MFIDLWSFCSKILSESSLPLFGGRGRIKQSLPVALPPPTGYNLELTNIPNIFIIAKI